MLAAASVGQVIGPVVVALLAQVFDLRVGLLTLVPFALVAAGALWRHLARLSG